MVWLPTAMPVHGKSQVLNAFERQRYRHYPARGLRRQENMVLRKFVLPYTNLDCW